MLSLISWICPNFFQWIFWPEIAAEVVGTDIEKKAFRAERRGQNRSWHCDYKAQNVHKKLQKQVIKILFSSDWLLVRIWIDLLPALVSERCISEFEACCELTYLIFLGLNFISHTRTTFPSILCKLFVLVLFPKVEINIYFCDELAWNC